MIKAISAVQGELILRGVSLEQLETIAPDVILVSDRNLKFKNPTVTVQSQMDMELLCSQLLPIKSNEVSRKRFIKGDSKLICFLGLAGGVGTTTLAINYAFELSAKTDTALIDLADINPEIARNLSLHRITDRFERIGKHLQVTQNLPTSSPAPFAVFDLGADTKSPILDIADKVYLVTRLNANTEHRLAKVLELPINLPNELPIEVILNFVERSRPQLNWLRQINQNHPRLKCAKIPYDLKAFELALERKSALLEVAPNSLARKVIATLAQCEFM